MRPHYFQAVQGLNRARVAYTLLPQSNRVRTRDPTDKVTIPSYIGMSADAEIHLIHLVQNASALKLEPGSRVT